MDDKNTPLFEGLPGEPLLLQCNLSEHYSNVLITADDGFGAVDYRPGISMKDGRLAKEAGVYDFSIYEAALEEDTVQSAMDLLMQTEEIQMAMQQGMSLMYTGDTELIDGPALPALHHWHRPGGPLCPGGLLRRGRQYALCL